MGLTSFSGKGGVKFSKKVKIFLERAVTASAMEDKQKVYGDGAEERETVRKKSDFPKSSNREGE